MSLVSKSVMARMGGVRDSEGKEATRKGVRVNAREAEQVARELFKLVVFQGGDAKVSL